MALLLAAWITHAVRMLCAGRGQAGRRCRYHLAIRHCTLRSPCFRVPTGLARVVGPGCTYRAGEWRTDSDDGVRTGGRRTTGIERVAIRKPQTQRTARARPASAQRAHGQGTAKGHYYHGPLLSLPSSSSAVPPVCPSPKARKHTLAHPHT